MQRVGAYGAIVVAPNLGLQPLNIAYTRLQRAHALLRGGNDRLICEEPKGYYMDPAKADGVKHANRCLDRVSENMAGIKKSKNLRGWGCQTDECPNRAERVDRETSKLNGTYQQNRRVHWIAQHHFRAAPSELLAAIRIVEEIVSSRRGDPDSRSLSRCSIIPVIMHLNLKDGCCYWI